MPKHRCLWLFGLVDEVKGCNYSRIEIRPDTLQSTVKTHADTLDQENWIIVCCRSGNTGCLKTIATQRPKVKGLVTSSVRCDRYWQVWALHLGLHIDLHRASSVWSRHVSFCIRKRRLFRIISGYGIVVPVGSLGYESWSGNSLSLTFVMLRDFILGQVSAVPEHLPLYHYQHVNGFNSLHNSVTIIVTDK